MTDLLLLPGLDGTGLLFEPLLERLPSTVVPHVVGYPRNRALDYDGHLRVAEERLPASGRFILLGESFSGPVAVRIARKHPERVRGLILVATFVSNPLASILHLFRPLLPALTLLRSALPSYLIRRWLLDPSADDRIVRMTHDAVSSVAPNVLGKRIDNVFSVDVAHELQHYSGPVLYLKARRDKVISEKAYRRVIATRKDIDVVEFDTPHMIAQYDPRSVASTIARWMEGRLL